MPAPCCCAVAARPQVGNGAAGSPQCDVGALCPAVDNLGAAKADASALSSVNGSVAALAASFSTTVAELNGRLADLASAKIVLESAVSGLSTDLTATRSNLAATRSNLAATQSGLAVAQAELATKANSSAVAAAGATVAQLVTCARDEQGKLSMSADGRCVDTSQTALAPKSCQEIWAANRPPRAGPSDGTCRFID